MRRIAVRVPVERATRSGLPMVRLLVAELAIGAAAIFARVALGGAGPFAVAALRLGIATVVMLCAAQRFARIGRRRELAFAAAGAALAVHFATWIGSLLYTSVAVSTLLVTTTPLWTELYDLVRERRLPTRSYLLALGLAVLGVTLIVVAGNRIRPAPIAGHELAGDALALVGSVAIGVYFLIVRAAGRAGDGVQLGTRQIVARTYGWAALILALLAVMTQQPPPAADDVAAWTGIFAMALISQTLGHTALNAALRDFSPTVVAMTTLLEPVVAAVFAALIFRETLSWPAAAGGVFVLGAIAITLRAHVDARAPGAL